MGTEKVISNKSYLYSLFFLVVLISLVALFFSLNRVIGGDDFEHIHSAWYIKSGHIPYRDFFQHHHPLLWYLIVPFLVVFGDSVRTVIILRLVMFVLTLGTGFVTYSIAKKVTGSREAGLLSILLLLSNMTFLQKSVEIRPDVPQVLFGLISIYYLTSFFQSKDSKHMVFAGIAASISFLFLQKTVFLLFAYAAIFIFKLLRRQISVKSVLWFALCFSLPLLFFLFYLVISGIFEDYFLTNWVLNIHRPKTPTFVVLRNLITNSRFFWLLSAVSLGFVFLSKKINYEGLKTIALIGLVLLFSTFLARKAYMPYFMFAIALLCISCSGFLKYICERFELSAIYKLLVVLIIIVGPSRRLLRKSTNKTNYSQLDKVNFVIQNSDDSDLIYDGDSQFNLYRYDLHYFWYSVGENKCLDTYNKITNNKYGDYNICELVKSKKPKFISDFAFNIGECGLSRVYKKTRYAGLYIRKEEKEPNDLKTAENK